MYIKSMRPDISTKWERDKASPTDCSVICNWLRHSDGPALICDISCFCYLNDFPSALLDFCLDVKDHEMMTCHDRVHRYECVFVRGRAGGHKCVCMHRRVCVCLESMGGVCLSLLFCVFASKWGQNCQLLNIFTRYFLSTAKNNIPHLYMWHVNVKAVTEMSSKDNYHSPVFLFVVFVKVLLWIQTKGCRNIVRWSLFSVSFIHLHYLWTGCTENTQ